MADLKELLNKILPVELSTELLEERSLMLLGIIESKSDNSLVAAGRFIEAAVKVLIFLKLQKIVDFKGISFQKEIDKLKNLPKTTLADEAITHLIPLTLEAAYAIRSKKRAAHARGKDPSLADANYLYSVSSWFLKEILDLQGGDTVCIPDVLLEATVPSFSFLQIINGERIVLDKDLAATDATLLLLASYGGKAEEKDINPIMEKYYKKSNISKSHTRLIENRLMHKQNRMFFLTELGVSRVIKLYQTK